MYKNMPVSGAAIIAISASMTAQAQDAVTQAGAATQADARAAAAGTGTATDSPAGSEIIVTGAARAQRRFDASYAINTLNQDTIAKIAPLNFADLIGQLPGFQTESTGGEVQNIYRIRGLPNDGGFVSFQQDGLPLFHENDGVFFRGDAILRQDIMTQRLEVVRGGPAPVFASYSGAIINAITREGSDTPAGGAQVTLGDTGLYRLDAYQSGPLGNDTYFAVGGFIRHHDGYRDNGFPNDRGGQIRANIRHDLANGFVKLSANYVNDKNVFYLPIPIADPRNPSVSLDPFIDYFDGTMNSPAFRSVTIPYRTGTGQTDSRTTDLADGRHMRVFNAGLQYEAEFDDWLVSAKLGYTQGKNRFTAFYSTTNPADADVFAAGYRARAAAAFGPVVSFGYTLAGTNDVYLPDDDSGLVMQGQYRDVASDFYSAQGNLSVAKRFETALGSHDITVGLYGSLYGMDRFYAYQNYLIEVAGTPRTLDLVAYNAGGAEVGRVTDNGVLNYAATLNGGDSDAQMFAIYANDTWEIVPGLRIDAGIRHEEYDYSGYGALTEQVDLGDRTTLADDATRGFTGRILNREMKTRATNWTVGANYDFSNVVGIYARASHLETPPNVQSVMEVNPNPVFITTIADQYEVGLKLASGRSYLYATGFYSNFDPLNASFLAFDPTTGRNDVNVPFIGEAQILGVELDGALSLTSWFTLNGALTISDPKYKNFQSATGADPEQVEGNQITRQPKVYGNIRPTFDFAVNDTDVSVYGRYTYMGERFVDLYNNTALPAYGTVGAGITVNHGPWQVQVVGDDLFNERGLTEGNTRTDSLAGQGNAEAIYGRPIFGRNVRLVVGLDW
ncbi:TonB-dependent receptor [Croceibacterium mercuriale]|uniref:TonB-dependent receptor n=1 Tax=Croceibacterium mercuriale TaxID=1572751 RepID=A0A0B2BZM7_9SPHN|nr:TonB-dependent receptor [Croceibacterium mercuriale]